MSFTTFLGPLYAILSLYWQISINNCQLVGSLPINVRIETPIDTRILYVNIDRLLGKWYQTTMLSRIRNNLTANVWINNEGIYHTVSCCHFYVKKGNSNFWIYFYLLVHSQRCPRKDCLKIFNIFESFVNFALLYASERIW